MLLLPTVVGRVQLITQDVKLSTPHKESGSDKGKWVSGAGVCGPLSRAAAQKNFLPMNLN